MKLAGLFRLSRVKLAVAAMSFAVGAGVFVTRGHIAELMDPYLGFVGLAADADVAVDETAHETGAVHGNDDAEKHSGSESSEHGAPESSHGETGKPGSETSKEVTMPAEVFEPPSKAGPVAGAIRDLVRTQAEAALGQENAVKAQVEKIKGISAIAKELEGKELSAQDAQALSLYALSGGSALALAQLPETLHVGKRDKELLEGAIHFSLGNVEAAAPLLRDKHLKDYPPNLAAMLALAQFQVDGQLTNEGRKERLAFAASVMPGTLVEEAALRRTIDLSATLGEKRRFYATALRYLRRFPASHYSNEFRAAIFSGALKLESAIESGHRRELDGLLAALPPTARIELLGHLSRESLRSGKAGLCSYAVQKFRDNSGNANATQKAQLRLYETACLAPKGEDGPDTKWIEAPGVELTASDKKLAMAVGALRSLIWDKPSLALEDDDRPPRNEEPPAIKASVTQHLRTMQELIERAKK